MKAASSILDQAASGRRLSPEEALELATYRDLPSLMRAAEHLALEGFGSSVTYSPKVFVPLTRLCRDVCHYCTFATRQRAGRRAFMSPEEVLAVARAGVAAKCLEALFTLGDKPELRYRTAREELAALGYDTTLAYLEATARLVFEETGLLPHLNPGVMNDDELVGLRRVSVSMGLMLESASPRLCGKGMPHWRSPDKHPDRRLAVLRAAGRSAVPFTTGVLVGIGETRRERIEALLAIRALHEEYAHVQEVIVQNFRAKPGTRMATSTEPDVSDYLWTVAVARLVLGSSMSIQAPPNLSPDALDSLLRAGINDWGGVSPVTPDHVNPEAPWPHLDALHEVTAAAGRVLRQRLAIAPRYAVEPERWVDSGLQPAVRRLSDAEGFAREDAWCAGSGRLPPLNLSELARPRRAIASARTVRSGRIVRIIERATHGAMLGEDEVTTLFSAAGPDLAVLLRAADDLRGILRGKNVTYVVNRNINYTNICRYACGFCAFAKGRSSRSLRGPGYDLDLEEISRRAVEAQHRGATEVCLQGGIHPRYTGATYLRIVAAVKAAAPDIHVHAFSPLEIYHGAQTLRVSLEEYLTELKRIGLSTLPGTAAEILDDEVRAVICPDKITTAQWLEVMRVAHRVGLRSTATIMFGHVDTPRHWARHLLRVRDLQLETGGFTELVPLPFVHMEAPLWRAGRTRSGPTFREAILMHAVARLALHEAIANIQTSWVKMGLPGAALCLCAGANDLGGTLMNESITRAAGGVNGQEQGPATLERLIRGIGRIPQQRTTLYLATQPPLIEVHRADA